MFFATLGVIASSIERLATEVRHLQRTEVLEAEEYFSPGQKGSSAMPHKRNPVLTENLTGLARMVRGYVTPALENVALWHERDISHSSVERFIGPDATITLDFALARLTGVIDKLVVYPERMQKNLDRMGGLVHSQRVLLALTQAGLSREDSYALVQRNAMKVWESDGELSLLDLLKADPEVSQRLSAEQLDDLFDLGYHLKHVDTIFARVFGSVRVNSFAPHNISGALRNSVVILRHGTEPGADGNGRRNQRQMRRACRSRRCASRLAAICSNCPRLDRRCARRRISIICSANPTSTLIDEPLGEFRPCAGAARSPQPVLAPERHHGHRRGPMACG